MRRELYRKDNRMSDTTVTINFDDLVDDVVATHVVADALPPRRALGITLRIFTIAIVDENNLIATRNHFDIPPNDELERWDRIRAAATAVEALSAATWTVEAALCTLLKCCFDNSRNVDFLDTDEIRILAGSSYAVGVMTRRQLPHLAKSWIAREAVS
jgi:hypothetical protein